MDEINIAIAEFVTRLRNADPGSFNPISMSRNKKRYSAAGLIEVIDLVASLPDQETRP